MRPFVVLVACLVSVLGACGDDDSSGPAMDAGTSPTSDASPRADARPFSRDAGLDAGPAGTECDPFSPNCRADEKCAVVVDTPGPDVAVRYACVPAETGLKGNGVLCLRGIDATPQNAEDMVTTDDCAGGSFCWRAPGAGFDTCQPLCRVDEPDCGPSDYCRTLNDDPPFGICTTAVNCDPVYQVGCAARQNCYAVANTQGDWLGTCFDVATTDGGVAGVGDPCMFINTCQGGTQCFALPLPDGGVSTDFRCQQLCDSTGLGDAGVPDGGSADGGSLDAATIDAAMDGGDPQDAAVPPDASLDAGLPDGGPTGNCEPTTTCSPLPAAPGRGYLTPTPLGLCQ